LRFRIYDLKI